ncbi:MAG: terminase small subunit [Acidobacteria bacterium]|nr:terminase small subunit [Acidobacteriota bacterium]
MPVPSKPKRKPTPRQKKFVEAMADPKTKSARQAALKAGYAETTASVDAYRMLQKPHISEAIEARIKRAIAHSTVTPEEVLGSAVFNMRGSVNDLMDEDGFFDLKKARETGAIDLVKEIEFIETTDIETNKREVKHKVKLESIAAARKEVANYIGLENFGDDQSGRLADFKRICNRIAEEAILQKVSEREMAEFFLSDERAGRLDGQLVRMIAERYLKADEPEEEEAKKPVKKAPARKTKAPAKRTKPANKISGKGQKEAAKKK